MDLENVVEKGRSRPKLSHQIKQQVAIHRVIFVSVAVQCY